MFDPKNTGTRQAKTMTMQIIEIKIAAELCFFLEFLHLALRQVIPVAVMTCHRLLE